MLCECTSEENSWAITISRIKQAPHLLTRPLCVSTITSVFKCLTLLNTNDSSTDNNNLPQGLNLNLFITFLTQLENQQAITNCLVRHLGERYPLQIKLAQTNDRKSKAKIPNQEARQGNKDDFYNQVTLSYNDNVSTKSIKIFNNLTLHVTGCKSPSEARVVATTAWDLLSFVFPIIRNIGYTQSIQMMNATTEFNFSVNLKTLFMRMRPYIYVNYDPVDSNYPGAIAKYPIKSGDGKDVTIMLFASGNVAFSSKSLVYILEAYNFLLDFMQQEKGFVQSKEPILSKRKQDEATKKRKYTLKGPRKNARVLNSITV